MWFLGINVLSPLDLLLGLGTVSAFRAAALFCCNVGVHVLCSRYLGQVFKGVPPAPQEQPLMLRW